uniref:Uncharacterized protein n=1 Tax=Cannabis sativa TaxID=3483 RepID=A0A803P1E0_CANSA
MEHVKEDSSDCDGTVLVPRKQSEIANGGAHKKVRVETKEKVEQLAAARRQANESQSRKGFDVCEGEMQVRGSTQTTKDNQDLLLPPPTSKNIPATSTQLSREKTTLPPPPFFNFLVRPTSMLEEVRAHMEAIDQFYLKRHVSEYDETGELASNISTRCNVEFADYDKWDEPVPNIINRAEMTERLHPRVGIDLAPFLSDLLDQRATANCKLRVDRFAMMASGDPIYMVDTMRTQANTERVNDSLDKDMSHEKKGTKTERDHGDKYKEEYTQPFSWISYLEADLKQAKLNLKDHSKEKSETSDLHHKAEEAKKEALKKVDETIAELGSTKQTLAQACEESQKKTLKLEG